MNLKARSRLAIDAALTPQARVTLTGNQAHYLMQVLRLRAGESFALFNRTDGEWAATLTEVRKRELVVTVGAQLRPATKPLGFIVCFAPIKGGRMETIIEKATELGASVLQPVLTQRTIVDKVNLTRADSIAREAAEQCERTDWPEIREPVKFAKLLGDWPVDLPLIYGDESGASKPIMELLIARDKKSPSRFKGEARRETEQDSSLSQTSAPLQPSPYGGGPWGILAGPEGGFTPEELATLAHVPSAIGVGLGPRILRADTAVITLCALTLAAWGDWQERPRFKNPSLQEA